MESREEAVNLRDKLGDDPRTTLAFLSPSGLGVKALVRVDPAPPCRATYKRAWAEAANEYRRYHADIDTTGSDPSRLCYVSHDPEAVYNGDADALNWLAAAGVGGKPPGKGDMFATTTTTTPAPVAATIGPEGVRRHPTVDEVRGWLARVALDDERVSQSLADRNGPPGEYGVWRTVMFAMKSWGGAVGDDVAREMFDEWAQTQPRYDAENNAKMWQAAAPQGGVTVKTLVHMARAAGPETASMEGREVDAGDKLSVQQAAEAVADAMRPDFQYTALRGWYGWTREGWRRDPESLAVERAAGVAMKKAGAAKGARASMVVTALRPLLEQPDEWDREPHIAGLPGGKVVDLATGTARPVERADLVTMSLGAQPDSRPPERWLRFLTETLGEERAAWLRAYMGYLVTGLTAEEVMLFLQGPPGTGKSTLTEVLRAAMGSYSVVVAGERATESAVGHHRQWLARCAGKRLVAVSEIPPKSRWSVELMDLAAGGLIEANFMRHDSFDFQAVAKVVINGNFRPVAPPGSGIWRRLALVEMTYQPPKPDKGLKRELQQELPAIVGDMVGHARRYLERGLPDMPRRMREATASYREESDDLLLWLADCCVLGAQHYAPAKELHDSFKSWQEDNGKEHVVTLTTFGRMLGDAGFGKERRGVKKTTVRIGLALKD